MPRIDEGPFLNQERKLIDALAERIGRVAERIRAVEQVRAANQQLRATEQQLRATNQQLKADEQQLRAANQQLRAANQQLQATEQQLRAANHQLKADEQQLQAANQQLRATNQQLQATEQQLRAANQQLKAEEEKLRRINQRLRERKKELRRSREVYRALFEGTMNGVVVYEGVDNGSDFVFKDFNPAAERIEKVKREDLIGRSVQEVFPGVREMGLFDVFMRVWNTGKTEHFPAIVYKDERIEGWRENHVFKLATGEVVAIYRDVTESKRAQQEIIDKQQQLRALAAKLSSAEEDESRRIAGAIHDDLIQPLVFLDIKVKSLLGKTRDDDLLDSFGQMRAMLAELIQHARSFTFDLSYPVLYELGLEAAIEEWMRTEIWKKHKIAVEFRGDGRSKNMDHAMATFLFKSVKELLINIVKHSKANNVEVSIDTHDDVITICVTDDGRGFDLESYVKKRGKLSGFGLFNIRERLVHLGGNMNIETKLGRGCKVFITVPLEQINQE